MSKFNKKIIPLLINILIIFFELIGFFYVIRENGIELFIYYTWDSNILLLIASILFVVNYFIPLKNQSFYKVFFYIAVVCVSTTFFTVLFILLPIVIPDGKTEIFRLLFSPADHFHHIVCPILAIICFFIIREDTKFNIIDSIISIFPTLIYGIVLLILNYNKVIIGPYPFFHVYEQSILCTCLWTISLFVLTFVIGVLLMVLHNLQQKYIKIFVN